MKRTSCTNYCLINRALNPTKAILQLSVNAGKCFCLFSKSLFAKFTHCFLFRLECTFLNSYLHTIIQLGKHRYVEIKQCCFQTEKKILGLVKKHRLGCSLMNPSSFTFEKKNKFYTSISWGNKLNQTDKRREKRELYFFIGTGQTRTQKCVALTILNLLSIGRPGPKSVKYSTEMNPFCPFSDFRQCCPVNVIKSPTLDLTIL